MAKRARAETVQRLAFRGNVSLDIEEDFVNDTANGTRVWEAGQVLARAADAHALGAGVPWADGARVLELGAGTGVTGLLLAALGAEVTMGDNNELVLALLAANVQRNNSRAHVEQLDWRTDTARFAAREWDWIVGADCVFSLAATASLVDFLTACMEHKPTVGCMAVETRDDAVTLAFLRGLRAKGFVVHELPLDEIPELDPELMHPDMHLFRFQHGHH